jgi:hypothetical protein
MSNTECNVTAWYRHSCNFLVNFIEKCQPRHNICSALRSKCALIKFLSMPIFREYDLWLVLCTMDMKHPLHTNIRVYTMDICAYITPCNSLRLMLKIPLDKILTNTSFLWQTWLKLPYDADIIKLLYSHFSLKSCTGENTVNFVFQNSHTCINNQLSL